MSRSLSKKQLIGDGRKHSGWSFRAVGVENGMPRPEESITPSIQSAHAHLSS